MTPHAKKVSLFTRPISDTRLSLLWQYGVHIVGIALMSKQRTLEFVTKIFRKTCSSLVKIIFDEENNSTEKKFNKLQKISAFLQKITANMRSSTVQLHGVDLIDIQIQNWL